jgi:hypothetical protein
MEVSSYGRHRLINRRVVDNIIGTERALVISTGVANGLTVRANAYRSRGSLSHNVPNSVQGLQPKALIVGDE